MEGLVDLIEDALYELTYSECPHCQARIETCEYIGRADIEKWLRSRCPKCHTKLAHFSGLEHIPAYLYCPKCLDVAYDYDRQELFSLV